MAHIRPFRGLRPVTEKIAEVASPPYDVLNSEEAREKAKDKPYSFLHIVKPEIDLEPDVDLYDSRVYSKAGENLKKFIDDGVLVQDKNPCFYVYTLQMAEHIQIGIVAAASVEEYDQNKIKKHEFTRPDKENDRMAHIDHLNAQTGPVFLTYRAVPAIDLIVKKVLEKEPVYDFIGDHDVKHTVYVVEEQDQIEAIIKEFSKIDALYVADGHHRSAAASRVCAARKADNSNHTGNEEYNSFLSVIFPDNQMKILDYNRVVKDLNGFTVEDFISVIKKSFNVEPAAEASACKPETVHSFGMYLNGKWCRLQAKEDSYDSHDPIKSLDVSILQQNLLNPVLGIKDPRTDKRINFVGGIRGMAELERLVKSGEYAVAFALFPTGIDQLMAVADSNQVMPPKSTWFEPKLASGVVVHLLE